MRNGMINFGIIVLVFGIVAMAVVADSYVRYIPKELETETGVTAPVWVLDSFRVAMLPAKKSSEAIRQHEQTARLKYEGYASIEAMLGGAKPLGVKYVDRPLSEIANEEAVEAVIVTDLLTVGPFQATTITTAIIPEPEEGETTAPGAQEETPVD